jgi:hypothetical protein
MPPFVIIVRLCGNAANCDDSNQTEWVEWLCGKEAIVITFFLLKYSMRADCNILIFTSTFNQIE